MTDAVVVMTGFARALRTAGVGADRVRLTACLEALAHLDPLDTDQAYWAGRLTLCSEPDDLPTYDAVFDSWFRGASPPAAAPATPSRRLLSRALAAPAADGAEADEDDEDDEEPLRTAASGADVLRRRDVLALTAEERAEVERLIALLRPRVGYRKAVRRGPHRRGSVDVGRTVRLMLRDGGEPGGISRRRPRRRPRRLVLLLDVSGSMSPY